MERELPCAATCEWEVCNGRDNHHLYWPKRRYKGGVERKFRNLGMNVVEMCRNEHSLLHRTTQPPKKPSMAEMWEAIHEAQL